MLSTRMTVYVFIVFLTSAVFAASGESVDSNDLSAYYGFGEIEIIKLEWGISGLQIIDLNGDDLNDIAVVNNRKAKIEVLLQRETPGPGEAEVAVDPNDADINTLLPQTHFDRESIALSQQIYSIVCGDLNSDGLPDIAFYGEPKGLYVLLQKAAEMGAPGQHTLNWRTKRKIAIDDGFLFPTALACEDLNGDGKVDLALASREGVYVVTQKEGGTLAEPVKYPISGQILKVDIADLNGDKLNDLVMVTNDAEKPVQVRFGLKGGFLGPQVQFFIERPFAFRLHDMDGSSGQEILTIDGRSGRLLCYKLTSGTQDNIDWPILLYPLSSGEGSNKRDLVTGDFDGDGRRDIVLSDPGSAELVFYRQQEKIGLAEPVRFPAFADITSLSAIDVDGDGKSELGVLSVKEKVVGLSSFADERLSFPKPLEVAGEPVAMDFVDIDENGRPDCVYVSKDANDTKSLGIIYDVGKSKTSDNSTAENGGDKQQRFSMTLKNLKANPEGLRVFDADHDGLDDILLFVSYEMPTLVRQVRPGEFEVVDPLKAQTSLIKEASMRSTAVESVDGKAGEELLVAQRNFARSLVFADGKTWRVVDQYNAKSTENQVSTVAAFALDAGDIGKGPAIVLLDGQKGKLQILRAGDDSTYRFEKECNVGQWNVAGHLKMLLAPVGPGGVDSIVLFDSEKFALVIPPTRDSGAEHLEQQFSYETRIKDGTYGNLVAGDINGDGCTDIVMVEYKRNHIEILTLDSAGQPVPTMRFKIFEQKSYRDENAQTKASVEPREMNIADVTNDDKADLITIIHDRIIVYPQD